jgi:hypothetical protein
MGVGAVPLLLATASGSMALGKSVAPLLGSAATSAGLVSGAWAGTTGAGSGAVMGLVEHDANTIAKTTSKD